MDTKIRESMIDFVNSPNTKQAHDAIYTSTEQGTKAMTAYIKERQNLQSFSKQQVVILEKNISQKCPYQPFE